MRCLLTSSQQAPGIANLIMQNHKGDFSFFWFSFTCKREGCWWHHGEEPPPASCCFETQVWELHMRTSAWIMSLQVIWVPRTKQNRRNKSSLNCHQFYFAFTCSQETWVCSDWLRFHIYRNGLETEIILRPSSQEIRKTTSKAIDR